MKFKSLKFMGFPDYRVSDEGVVQSRKVYGSKIGGLGPWWVMKHKTRVRDPHPYVDLFRQTGKPERFFVHQLVAWAFLGPQPEGKIVCHRDDDSKRNVPDNLYYGTHETNMADAFRNGGFPVGEDWCKAKLKNAQVLEIRKVAGDRGKAGFAWGEKRKFLDEMGKKFGVRGSYILRIIRREIWKHI